MKRALLSPGTIDGWGKGRIVCLNEIHSITVQRFNNQGYRTVCAVGSRAPNGIVFVVNIVVVRCMDDGIGTPVGKDKLRPAGIRLFKLPVLQILE